MFDLAAYTVDRLSKAGVAGRKASASAPMRRRTLFFSYRRATHRNEPDYGRQISAIIPGD